MPILCSGWLTSVALTMALASGQAVDRTSEQTLVDISSTVRCTEAGCSFSPELNQALTDLLVEDEEGGTYYTRPIHLGGRQFIPRLASEQVDVGVPGSRETRSEVAFDGIRVRWNGLAIVGLEATSGFESSTRAVVFAERAEVVRATLRRFGVIVPALPASHELQTEGCSASIGLEQRTAGTAFVHAGWC